MFDWSVAVVDSLGMDREAVAVRFNLLDRYLLVHETISKDEGIVTSRDDYQLYLMVCLFIAIKIWESYPRKLTVQSLVDMSKNYYTEHVIEATEREILKALHWHVHAPTAHSFARILHELVPETQSLHTTAITLSDLAVRDAHFVGFASSDVCLAALVCAARHDGNFCLEKSLLAKTQGLMDSSIMSDFSIILDKLETVYTHL